MKVKTRLQKVCSYVLVIAMVLTIVGVIIPQPISLATSAITSTMNDQNNDSAATLSESFADNSSDRGIYAPLTQESDSHWALLNVILSVTGALLAIVMAIRFITMKRFVEYEESEEQENEERSRLLMLLAAPILAILAILLFIITQDPIYPMVIADNWTLTHILLFFSGLLTYVSLMKKEKSEDNNEDKHAKAGV